MGLDKPRYFVILGRVDWEIEVMISLLKTGGVGLDFSVANKCTVVDLRWNEAIQDHLSTFL